jgi:hypothetical protein
VVASAWGFLLKLSRVQKFGFRVVSLKVVSARRMGVNLARQ